MLSWKVAPYGIVDSLFIYILRSDNTTEYVNSNNKNPFLKKHGIIHEKLVPYNQEQNGLAERVNRTILERARTMLKDDKPITTQVTGLHTTRIVVLM